MNINRALYWTLVFVFSVYVTIMIVVTEPGHDYICETDEECYIECVEVTGDYENCE